MRTLGNFRANLYRGDASHFNSDCYLYICITPTVTQCGRRCDRDFLSYFSAESQERELT